MKCACSVELLEQEKSDHQFIIRPSSNSQLSDLINEHNKYSELLKIHQSLQQINKNLIPTTISRFNPHGKAKLDTSNLNKYCHVYDELPAGKDLGFFYPLGEVTQISESDFMLDKRSQHSYCILLDTNPHSEDKDDLFFNIKDFQEYLKKNHLKAKFLKYASIVNVQDKKTYIETFTYIPILSVDNDNPLTEPTININSLLGGLEEKTSTKSEPNFSFTHSITNGTTEHIEFSITLDADGSKALKEFITVTKKQDRETGKNNIEFIKEFISFYKILFPQHIVRSEGL